MIQDIYPHHLDNHYDPAIRPEADSIVMAFSEKSLLIKLDEEKGTVEYPRMKHFSGVKDEELVYLFSVYRRCKWFFFA